MASDGRSRRQSIYGRCMERMINRRQQGDLGEASAIEWLTRAGATVYSPVGHSRDCDLIAETGHRLLRIQVKTSTRVAPTSSGHARSHVAVSTRGGNRSGSGITKRLDPSSFDYLFVLTGDGRRWLIPAKVVDGGTAISLGGTKYSEYEIDPAAPIAPLVYGQSPSLESTTASGEYPSGQRMATVNRPAQPSQVRILPPPFQPRPGFPASKFDRRRSRAGEAILNQKRRVTLPRRACIEAGLKDGDRVLAQSDGDGRIVLERIEPPPQPLG